MEETKDRQLASVRAAELGVALFIFLLGAISIKDSIRLGHGWSKSIGPESGYFPFYIGVIICACAVVIAITALRNKAQASEVFVTRGQFVLVLKVLVPTAIYTVAIEYLGIYVASAIFIGLFMWWLGKYGLLKILPIALGVPIAFFVLFEQMFHVPLPKGPLEAMLGLL